MSKTMKRTVWNPYQNLKLPFELKGRHHIEVNINFDALRFDAFDEFFAVMVCCPQHVFEVEVEDIFRVQEYLQTRTPINDSGRYATLPQWYHVICEWLDSGVGERTGDEDSFFYSEKLWDRVSDLMSQINYHKPDMNVIWKKKGSMASQR